MKLNPHLIVKFFEKPEIFKRLSDKIKQKEKKGEKLIELLEEEEEKCEHDELDIGLTAEKEMKKETQELDKLIKNTPYVKDYLLFAQDLCKMFFGDNVPEIKPSNEKRKEISRHFKGVKMDFIKHLDLATSLKAFIGAIYNSAGPVSAAQIMSKFDMIKHACICVYSGRKSGLNYLDYDAILNRFDKLQLDLDRGFLERASNKIKELTGYDFKCKNVLAIALTHKTMSKSKKNYITDDYNIMEFLGDSVVKFFNCKRILKLKDRLLENKEPGFSDIQRLKFIRTSSEKNSLFGYICANSGISQFIRHSTNNKNDIELYTKYVKKHPEIENVDDVHLNKHFVKMLADVIESIVGAILIDSCSLEMTERAWKKLFVPYLERFADDPSPPPKRAFGKFCESQPFLKALKDSELEVETYSREQLRDHYNFEYKNPVMKYDLKYKGRVVFRRYFENAVKSKDKLFYRKLKIHLHYHVVPNYNKVLEAKLGSKTETNEENNTESKAGRHPYINNQLMGDHDKGGEYYFDIKAHTIIVQKIYEERKSTTNKKNKEMHESTTNIDTQEMSVISKTTKDVKKEQEPIINQTPTEDFNEWLLTYYLETKFGTKMIQDFSQFAKTLKD